MLTHSAGFIVLLSASVVAGKSCLGAGLFILADVIMVIILLIRRHRIEPGRIAGPAGGVI